MLDDKINNAKRLLSELSELSKDTTDTETLESIDNVTSTMNCLLEVVYIRKNELMVDTNNKECDNSLVDGIQDIEKDLTIMSESLQDYVNNLQIHKKLMDRILK